MLTSIGSKLLELAGEAFNKIIESVIVEAGVGVLTIGLFYVAYQVFASILSQIIQNKTALENLQLVNDSEFMDLVQLYASNFLYMVLTLGLYWPWARIRVLQYRASHLEIVGDLQDMRSHNIAAHQQAAYGQEAAAAMDFDVSF